jgi:hypothetical protein
MAMKQTDEGAYLPAPDEIAREAALLREKHYAAKRANNRRTRARKSEKVRIPKNVDCNH